jgi:hypothetical protein
MPGLLLSQGDHGKKYYAALAAELGGVLLFAFLGGAAPSAVAAWANGIALAVLGKLFTVLVLHGCTVQACGDLLVTYLLMVLLQCTSRQT